MYFLLDGRHIQDHFPGIGRYVFNLAQGLARVVEDERVRILFNPGTRNTRFDLASLASSGSVELVPVGASTWSLREQLLGADRRLMADAALWHSAYYVMPYVLPVRSVVTMEDVIPLVLREEMPGALNRLLYRLLNQVAARRAAHVITISKAASEDIRRLLGIPSNKLSVIPLAADSGFHPRNSAEITRMREQLDLPEHYALYVGSNKPHKNLERLVQAWGRVGSDSILVIAGHWDGRYPDAKLVAEQLGLKGRVLFRANVSNSDLPALLSGAELFVFPSLYEGFGLPPLEAMACGTPLVCSNASTLPDLVGDAALLFDPLNVHALGSALERVLQDEALRDSLREKGLVQAQRFSWERTARATLGVYGKVVSNQ